MKPWLVALVIWLVIGFLFALGYFAFVMLTGPRM